MHKHNYAPRAGLALILATGAIFWCGLYALISAVL